MECRSWTDEKTDLTGRDACLHFRTVKDERSFFTVLFFVFSGFHVRDFFYGFASDVMCPRTEQKWDRRKRSGKQKTGIKRQ